MHAVPTVCLETFLRPLWTFRSRQPFPLAYKTSEREPDERAPAVLSHGLNILGFFDDSIQLVPIRHIGEVSQEECSKDHWRGDDGRYVAARGLGRAG